MDAAAAAQYERRRFDADKVLRCDIAKALMRSSGDALVLDSALDAPPFVIAFDMLEPTTIPKLLQDAVWVLNNIKSCTEKGEGGAYITCLPGLNVTLDQTSPNNKGVIRRTLEDGTRTQVNEISMQVRVHEVSALLDEREEEEEAVAAEASGGGGGGRPCKVVERFLLLVARSPLAYSLRKAAYTTTRSVGRLTVQDTRGADERRRVWAQLAMHVRAPLHPILRGGDLMEKFEPSMDWMRNGEADGFTCLFSMQRAVDWMKARFISKYSLRYRFRSNMAVHGLNVRMKLPREITTTTTTEEEEEEEEEGDDYLVTPGFVDECRKYDDDVDR
jgi:hypothetical protein